MALLALTTSLALQRTDAENIPLIEIKSDETAVIFSTAQKVEVAAKPCIELKAEVEVQEKAFEAKPLKVSETLIILLEKVKSDPQTRNALIMEFAKSKEDSPKGEEYRLLLLKLLAENNSEATRGEIEKIADLEKDWVLIENDGKAPEGKIYENSGPTLGQRIWQTAKTVGGITFSAGCLAGKITYRIYVEGTRIGTFVLLGVMVIQNPLFPILNMLVHTLLKVLVK